MSDSLLTKHIDVSFTERWLGTLGHLRIVVVDPVSRLANVANVMSNMHTCAQVSNEALQFVVAIGCIS